MDNSFGGLAVVAAIAFAAPLVLGLVPGLRLPAVVLELVAGIAVGPSALGWVEAEGPVRTLALIGLAFLLLLAGLEIDFERLRGRVLRSACVGFVVSFALALAVAAALAFADVADSPLLIAIMLAATSLGIVVPVLRDARESSTPFGQLVLAGATVADAVTIVLLSLLFSERASSTGAQAILLGGFALLAVAVAVALLELGRWGRLSAALVRLQDTTAQIRVRGAFLLLALFVVLAERFGIETILGAFLAGATLKLVDRDRAMTHPRFHEKLEVVGFGVFVPFFFVASGAQLDLDALLESGAALALVPIVLASLLVVRGVPALLYGLDRPHTAAAALLQATSLGFLVVASRLGMDLGLIDDATGAALVAGGLLSVLIFPAAALAALRRNGTVTPANGKRREAR